MYKITRGIEYFFFKEITLYFDVTKLTLIFPERWILLI